MNKTKVVEEMIKYIEEEERELQTAKMMNDSHVVRTDIVNGILEKLEKVIEDEN